MYRSKTNTQVLTSNSHLVLHALGVMVSTPLPWLTQAVRKQAVETLVYCFTAKGAGNHSSEKLKSIEDHQTSTSASVLALIWFLLSNFSVSAICFQEAPYMLCCIHMKW